MSTRALMRKLEDFEGPRLVALGGALFGASFFLMKLLPARFMLERAVERDQLKPEATICESSSGTAATAATTSAAARRKRSRCSAVMAAMEAPAFRLSPEPHSLTSGRSPAAMAAAVATTMRLPPRAAMAAMAG
ncbi:MULTISPECIES: hypothetical protein [unclassified Mesorhizobium]|uniref:hypothetical protein n=1 Tax=unclassified Mesorhizobium TaxID=325217 RepID=UPI0015E2A5DC|nr:MULTISPECIES: hypothetical protein [unclassified Mesorhizobium]UCI16439.1 hypothetical protein FJ972_28065 [Mesorhizobium sp. B2-1-1]